MALIRLSAQDRVKSLWNSGLRSSMEFAGAAVEMAGFTERPDELRIHPFGKLDPHRELVVADFLPLDTNRPGGRGNAAARKIQLANQRLDLHPLPAGLDRPHPKNLL